MARSNLVRSWTAEEDALMASLAARGVSIHLASAKLRRSVLALRTRGAKIGVYFSNYSQSKPRAVQEPGAVRLQRSPSSVQAQLKGHQEAVALFETYSAGGDNAGLKAWAAKTLPHQTHLQMAEKLK